MAIFLLFRPGSAIVPGTTIPLEPDEHRHAKARRLGQGEKVWIGDGRGQRAPGILQADLKSIQIGGPVIGHEEAVRTLFTPVVDPSRFDWMIEKAVELGVTDVIPVIYARSPKAFLKNSRTERIIHAAALQSERWTLPRLHEPVSFSEGLVQAAQMQCVVLDQSGTALAGGVAGNSCMVGPEGGFTPEELTQIERAHMRKVRLDAGILRVETAAIAGLVLLAL